MSDLQSDEPNKSFFKPPSLGKVRFAAIGS